MGGVDSVSWALLLLSRLMPRSGSEQARALQQTDLPPFPVYDYGARITISTFIFVLILVTIFVALLSSSS